MQKNYFCMKECCLMILQNIYKFQEEQFIIGRKSLIGIKNLQKLCKTINNHNSYDDSPIRKNIIDTNGVDFYEKLCKLIQKDIKPKERMMILLAASAAKKITYPAQCYSSYDEAFPHMFGTKQNWSAFMKNHSVDDDEIKELAKNLFSEK